MSALVADSLQAGSDASMGVSVLEQEPQKKSSSQSNGCEFPMQNKPCL